MFLCLTICFLSACGQVQPKTLPAAMNKFGDFKKKEKFGKEQFYPGLADPKMRPILTDKINLAADDFRSLAEAGNATDKDYQDKIKLGLQRFDNLDLDTEDKERVCTYFEEIMDIVGLESSGGHLNTFMLWIRSGLKVTQGRSCINLCNKNQI